MFRASLLLALIVSPACEAPDGVTDDTDLDSDTEAPAEAEAALSDASVDLGTVCGATEATFTIDNLGEVARMQLGADYDDGYVAWINGTEVYRSPEMPSGALAYDADHSGGVLYQVALDEMIPVFGRGGAAVPTQRNATTTAASRANPFSLAVFGAQATGMLFWDDGETTDTFKDGSFYHCLFHFGDNTLDIQVR